jgi:hypothetical protein
MGIQPGARIDWRQFSHKQYSVRIIAQPPTAADGGTAVLSSVVTQALLSGGAAPAAELWRSPFPAILSILDSPSLTKNIIVHTFSTSHMNGTPPKPKRTWPHMGSGSPKRSPFYRGYA